MMMMMMIMMMMIIIIMNRWNSLSQDTVDAWSVNAFKHHLYC